MVHIFVLPDASGEMLILGIRRKDKWIKYELRIEKFYSHKRVARLLRELAQKVEDFDGQASEGQGRPSDGDGSNARV